MSQELFTLPQKYFTSSEIFSEEIEKIFYEEWICVGRLEKISEPGEFMVQNIGDESIIILRDHHDVVRAFYNVCRHRGTQLCQEKSGKFSKTIQCPYHAWTYNLDGELIGVPSFDNKNNLSKKDYPLHRAELYIWEGFIFINLSEAPKPFDKVNTELIDRFAAWQISTLESVRKIEYEVAANWKLVIENYNECYHCPVIHPALVRVSPANSGQNILNEGAVIGGYMEFSEGNDGMTLSGHACALPIKTLENDDLNRVYYFSIFPNLLLSLHPDYVMFHTLWPQNNGQTKIVCEWLFASETIVADEFDPADAIDFWDMTNREDWHICEIAQLGIKSKTYQPGPYYEWHESLLAAFDKHVLEKLNHNKI